MNVNVVNIFTIAVPWLVKEKINQMSLHDATHAEEHKNDSFELFIVRGKAKLRKTILSYLTHPFLTVTPELYFD